MARLIKVLCECGKPLARLEPLTDLEVIGSRRVHDPSGPTRTAAELIADGTLDLEDLEILNLGDDTPYRDGFGPASVWGSGEWLDAIRDYFAEVRARGAEGRRDSDLERRQSAGRWRVRCLQCRREYRGSVTQLRQLVGRAVADHDRSVTLSRPMKIGASE